MTVCWEPGVQYDHGSVVEYQGQRYRIIQPHRSQSDWAPTVTPALWGRIEGHHDHHEKPPQQQGGQQPPQQQWGQQPPPPQQQWGQPPSQQQPYQQPPPPKVEIQKEESKKNWFDLDDDRKKQLEIGGGLLAGVAAIGAGYYAYNKMNKNEEEQKAQNWALSNWLRDAEARTEDYRRYGLRGPAQWILNRGKQIPPQAILIGPEHDWNLYVCRAFYEGGIQIGKASEAFKKGAVIGYDRDEIQLDTYEILVGDMRGLRWVDVSGTLNVNNLGYKPVEGGREADGTPLYVAKAPHKDAVHPGKCGPKLAGALIPYGGKEKEIKQYSVLCYA